MHFKKIAYIVIAIIMVFVDTNQTLANAVIVNESPEKIILAGNQQVITKTISNISNYIPKTQDNEQLEINKNKTEENVFVLKPTITDTKSREQIEKNKQEEELKKQNELAYNSYYNTYSDNTYEISYQRDVVVRETDRLSGTNGTNANSYSYGYCTWYVASMKNVPGLWGNAGEWLGSASQSGYSTGSTPQEGSIIVTGESGYGHVGIVERVEGNKIIISEMNYSGWGIVNEREIDTNNPVIGGYIY